jgi:hypothetical protein
MRVEKIHEAMKHPKLLAMGHDEAAQSRAHCATRRV